MSTTSTLMQRALAGALLIVSANLNAQPAPRVRVVGEIADFELNNAGNNLVMMPNGHVALYSQDSALYAFDFTTLRRAEVARGEFTALAVAPNGARLVWCRSTRPGNSVWTMPVDAQTGASKGTPALLSDINGCSPRFSPDGSQILYSSGRDRTLVIAPARGGPERKLGAFSRSVYADWGANGKSVFAMAAAPYPGVTSLDPGLWLDRFDIASGKRERIMKLASDSLGARGGRIWSTDGRATVYMPTVPTSMRGQFGQGLSFVTSEGTHGTLGLPSNAHWFGSSWSAGASHAQVVVESDSTRAYTVDVATGRITPLTPVGTVGRTPTWSPDGRRLAVKVRRGWDFHIMVMDKDGSRGREYPVTAGVPFVSGGMDGVMQWSPDGRYIAFMAPPRGAVSILDLATGKARSISSPTGMLQAVQWKRDSKSLLIVKDPQSLNRPVARNEPMAIYETRLDGSERLIRDLSTDFPGFIGATWISDSLIAMARLEKRIIVPVYGGPAREPATAPPAIGNWYAFVSTDGKHLLVRDHRAGSISNPPVTGFAVMNLAGDSTRRVELAEPGHPGAWQRPVLHPGGDFAIYVGDFMSPAARHNPTSVYVAPFDGSVSRLLTTLPGTAYDDQFQLSPDGTMLALTVRVGPPRMTVLDLDMSSILRSTKH